MISDSASGKSKGVRFTSAMLAIRKIMNARNPGGEQMFQPNSAWRSKIVTRLRLPAQSAIGIVESTWGISYETSCATDRIAPSSEYLLRLDQPARNNPSGLRLETAIKYTRPDGRSTGTRPAANGTTAITRNDESSTITGAIRWTTWSADRGTIFSLMSSLSPSAIGCNRPSGPTRLGPIRSWNRAATLRSSHTM